MNPTEPESRGAFPAPVGLAMTLVAAFLTVFLPFIAVADTMGAGTGDEESFSPANMLLFTTDHLRNVVEPGVLNYRYARSGTLEPEFTDQVVVRVTDLSESGGKDVQVEFLSGERRRAVPHMSDVRGNPVVMMFLQRDIYEMSRQTGGPWRYLQRRIKLALAESADLDTVVISLEGQDIEATRIRISPFLEDPERERLDMFVRKSYEFVVSDKVPGSVFRIRAAVPANEGTGGQKSPLLLEDVLDYRP